MSTTTKPSPQSSLCPGCNQPHFYCSCGYHVATTTTTQHDFVNQDPTGNGSFVAFNNSQDTFKPSDIFNFEVNLNLNYSACTTNHHYHSTPQVNSQGGITPGVVATSVATPYGYGGDDHFIQQALPHPPPNYPQISGHPHHHYQQQQNHHNYNNNAQFHGGGFNYDGWSSNAGSNNPSRTPLHNGRHPTTISFRCAELYQILRKTATPTTERAKSHISHQHHHYNKSRSIQLPPHKVDVDVDVDQF
ncbi:hypothetical protein Fcan01_18438 [Folsomia candida]|uniref:Uncharacterized protein n=1 Tax=Folsomia candida TaxID=158441 RepID=A0A226DNA0_FOLCA|nr:hypothetical protein Fcan01_18438 [Folsomia candida]